jgi:hypothetical protein
MPGLAYRTLLSEFCRLAQVSDPARVLDTGQIFLGGTTFGLIPLDLPDEPAVQVMCFLDPPEAEWDRPAEDRYRAMLAFNQILCLQCEDPRDAGPRLGVAVDSNDEVLVFCLPLATTNAAGLLAVLEHYARFASRWRTGELYPFTTMHEMGQALGRILGQHAGSASPNCFA